MSGQHVEVPVGDGLLGILTMPPAARGVVVFAHGSRRLSPRNRAVAARSGARPREHCPSTC
jgi:hypothetical protein